MVSLSLFSSDLMKTTTNVPTFSLYFSLRQIQPQVLAWAAKKRTERRQLKKEHKPNHEFFLPENYVWLSRDANTGAKVLPGLEPGLRESESRVLTTTL